MVITLLALLAGLMVVPIQQLVRAIQVRPLEDVFLSTVRKAHILARQRNEPIVLGYNAASNLLQLSSQDGIPLEKIALERPDDTEDDEPLMEFRRILPEDPETTEFAYESADDPVSSIVFHPSGASMPFEVDFKTHGNPDRLVLDPFSSEPLLSEEEGHEP